MKIISVVNWIISPPWRVGGTRFVQEKQIVDYKLMSILPKCPSSMLLELFKCFIPMSVKFMTCLILHYCLTRKATSSYLKSKIFIIMRIIILHCKTTAPRQNHLSR